MSARAADIASSPSIPATIHRAKIAQPRVRMEGWRQRRPGSNARNPREGKRKQKEQTEKEKNALDSYRPSHGRSCGCKSASLQEWLDKFVDLIFSVSLKGWICPIRICTKQER